MTLRQLIHCCLFAPVMVQANCNIPDFIAKDKINAYLAETGQSCSNDKSMHDKAVYMTDNRFDVYLAEGAIKQAARSTAALILKVNLIKQGNEYISRLEGITQENGMDACVSERFSQQPVLSNCSAFLVDENILVTAGHCFKGDGAFPIEDYYVVFGYEMKSKSQAQLRFPLQDVYTIAKELEVRKSMSPREDWAVVQLDRTVKDRQIFEFSQAEIQKGTGLTMFGYPNGLPLKIADGGKVLENQHGKNVFATDVDAFKGNSGSPILNSAALKLTPPRYIVEGILVSGAIDAVKKNGCYKVEPCQTVNISYNHIGKCTSEIITKINRVLVSEPEINPEPSSNFQQNVIQNFF